MLDSDLYDSESTTNFFEEDVEGVDVDPSTTGNTFKNQFSSILNGNDFEPPEELSPRSAAKYVQNLLISKDGKKKGRKRRRKRRKKKNKNKTVDDEEEDDPLFLTKVASEQDQHYFPTPESMKKKRCAFIVEYNPLQCNICEGIHFRTKKTFQQNLDIIASVNESFGQVLGDMGSKMSFINVNLQKVKDNLDQLEFCEETMSWDRSFCSLLSDIESLEQRKRNSIESRQMQIQNEANEIIWNMNLLKGKIQTLKEVLNIPVQDQEMKLWSKDKGTQFSEDD
ncbi:unnamed protein product [Lepeophtheirus salmonis]|nr:unnamed protein product [Lepeophtheirus salmonis]CAF3000052.1 unnamed protein product [Lepeophtheirus salmonis]